jgi:hypothetical protein
MVQGGRTSEMILTVQYIEKERFTEELQMAYRTLQML